jgi:hypothetical protein
MSAAVVASQFSMKGRRPRGWWISRMAFGGLSAAKVSASTKRRTTRPAASFVCRMFQCRSSTSAG